MIIIIDEKNSEFCKMLPMGFHPLLEDNKFFVKIYSHLFLIPNNYDEIKTQQSAVSNDFVKIGIKTALSMYEQKKKNQELTEQIIKNNKINSK